MPRPTPLSVAVLAVGLLVAPPLRAQSIRGRLYAADSTPVAGAIVALVDTGGRAVDRVLSSAIGSYTLHAPGEGSYRVRVLRIGFPPFESRGLPLQPGTAGEFSPLLPDTPIVLNDIEVSAGSACRADGGREGVTATLLEEVRKAFGAVDLALRDRDLRFEVRRSVRRTDQHAVLVSQDSSLVTMTSWPVHSLPPERLRDQGFVVASDSVDAAFLPFGVTSGKVWFGPDPTTLFADPFFATHCYHTERDPHDSTRIGLAFAPVRGRHLPEIAGTLWLRRGTLALERLDYEYVNLPRQYREVRNGAAGGTMDFLRLPAGIWIVAGWDLRVPIERVVDAFPAGIGGYLEEGGRISHIRTRAGAVVY